MIAIKRLSEDRWREYRDLRLEALKTEPQAYGSSYEEERDRPESEWRRRIKNALFALADDKPVGMIVFVQESLLKTKHVTNIYAVYVTKERRGCGVGKQLMEAVLTQIKKHRDVKKIKIAVNPVQKAAAKLYQSCGFNIVGKLEKELYIEGKFYDEIVMEILL